MKFDKSTKLPKKTVFKLTKCANKTVISFLVLALSIMVIVFTINSSLQSFARYAILITSELISMTAIVLFIKNMGLCIKIKNDKYTTKQRVLRSVDSKRILDPNRYGKVLVFDDVRITIDETEAKKFTAGDTITMVFINGIKYPVVIKKEVESAKHAICG